MTDSNSPICSVTPSSLSRRTGRFAAVGMAIGVAMVCTALLRQVSAAPAAPATLAPSLATAVVTGVKQRKDAVVLQLPQEPSSLNPYATLQPGTLMVCAAIFEPLFKYTDKWELQAELASRLPVYGAGISKDGLTYRIALRPRVKWHDGQPFSSEDVKYTMDRFVAPRAGSLGYRGLEDVQAVEAPDAQTVILRLRSPRPGLLDALSGVYILPKHVLEKYNDALPSAFGRSPVGTGPFALDEWRGGVVKLEAWDGYYRGRPHLDSLSFKAVIDERVAVSQLEKGELNVMSALSPRIAKQLKGSNSLRVAEAATPTFEHLLFNYLNPILSDKRVRKAIAAIVPTDFIRGEVYFGLWKPAPSPSVSPPKSPTVKVPAYDLERARRYLDEAGWKVASDGIRVKGTRRLAIELVSTTGNRQREQVLEILRDEGRKVGIDFTVKMHPSSKFFASPDEGGVVDGGSFGIALFGVLGAVEPDLFRMLHSSMVPPEGTNAGHFRSTKADSLLEAWRAEVDPKQRAVLFTSLLDIAAEELPFIATFYWSRLDAYSERIRNVRPAGTAAGLVWNVWEWEIGTRRTVDSPFLPTAE